jgi:hypothetical protein
MYITYHKRNLGHSGKLVLILTFMAPFELLGTSIKAQHHFFGLASTRIF